MVSTLVHSIGISGVRWLVSGDALSPIGPRAIGLAVRSGASWRNAAWWIGTGSWAVLDQGLFALSNFVLNVFLARWLSPSEYGAFAVAYTVFLLLGTLHTAVLTEPMLVFGPGKYKQRLRAYLAVLLRGHWVFGSLVGTLFGLAGLVLWRIGDNSTLTPAMFGLAIASPFILFQWLMRRACYVNTRPRLAAGAGALYMGVMAAGVYTLFLFGWLAAATGLLVMAVASLISGAWLVHMLRMDGTTGNFAGIVRESLADHWTYGRWAVGAAALSWASGNILTLVLPAFAGLDAVGTLRAAFNLIMPILQVLAALGVVVLPVLVRARTRGRLWPIARLVLAGYVVVATSYGVALASFAVPLSRLVYGTEIPSLTAYVVVLAVLPTTAALVSVAGGALRALENPRAVFSAYLVSTCLSATVGTWMVYAYGALGAAIGMVIASVATVTVLVAALARSLRSLPVLVPEGGAD